MLTCRQGFYDVALRKEAERRAEAEEEYQVLTAVPLHVDEASRVHTCTMIMLFHGLPACLLAAHGVQGAAAVDCTYILCGLLNPFECCHKYERG